MRIPVRLSVAAAAVVASLGALAVPASASDHLFNAVNSAGATHRDFENPVAGNPSGTSGAAAQPGTVPGEGDPKDGFDTEGTGTPAVDHSLICVRSGSC